MGIPTPLHRRPGTAASPEMAKHNGSIGHNNGHNKKLLTTTTTTTTTTGNVRANRYLSSRRKEQLALIIATLVAFWLGLQIFGALHFFGMVGSGTADSPWGNDKHRMAQYTLDKDFFLPQQRQSSNALPVLVVGGSDGSGTRAVVDILKKMGVVIVADDPQTFDIHGSAMFAKLGWPKLITTVLGATNGTLGYTWDDLDDVTQHVVSREIGKLLKSVAIRYAEGQRRNRLMYGPPKFAENGKQLLVRGGPRGGQRSVAGVHPMAMGVAFAFKAPISMLVMPILAKFMGPTKFLHVVRDGRDIALSNNQSPVLKFYNATYPLDYQERSKKFQGDLYPVRGMQLWNDWNTHVHERWSNGNERRHDKEFDYMVLRTEDLMDPSSKFTCLKALADFVGSSMSNEELCCTVAKSATKDHGASTVHTEQQNNFAAHPEQWFQMGQRKRRRNDPFLGMDALDPRSFKERKAQLDDLDRLLELRKAEVEAKQLQLEELQAKINQHQKDQDGNHRRLADYRMKPELFLRQLASWQEHVQTMGEDYQTETLQKLLNLGKALRKQYELNSPALVGVVKEDEISETNSDLEHLLKEKQGNLEFEMEEQKQLQQATHKEVHARYGKWKTQLENRTELSRWLHQEGATGLKLFGYEPRVDWEYKLVHTNVTDDDFVCDDTAPCEEDGK